MSADFAIRRTLSAAQSRLLVDTAVADAQARSLAVTIVVVDESGVAKEMLRMDGTPMDTVQTATNKAYAAATLGAPSDEFHKELEGDDAAIIEFNSRPGFALIGGGVPVMADGAVAGAIGISGAPTGDEDREIAEAAIAKVTGEAEARPPTVR